MKTSFNSIGKAFKKMFSRPKKQSVIPAVVNEQKKQEEKMVKIPKMSESAHGRRYNNIAARALCSGEHEVQIIKPVSSHCIKPHVICSAIGR